MGKFKGGARRTLGVLMRKRFYLARVTHYNGAPFIYASSYSVANALDNAWLEPRYGRHPFIEWATVYALDTAGALARTPKQWRTYEGVGTIKPKGD